ncbi:MAG: hypothetical protein ACE15C_03140 [Phycisphaerae bacterium]
MSLKCTPVSWDSQETPAELRSLLRTLGDEYPIVEGRRRGAIRLKFSPGAAAGCVEVMREKNVATISYDKPFHAARGVGSVLSGVVEPGKPLRESVPFETFGMMLDCSRNAVMKPARVKQWLNRLALLGYNMAMLYTEDTYELEGEEYFGYLRGRYTKAELQDIDRHAAAVGIEMIACFQTLGHMEQILRWPAYKAVTDTSSVLLADEEATYALIEKMIAFWSSTYRSRRVNLCNDEAFDLGRGRFLDKFGYQKPFDIFNRHLARVVELCKKHGLRPMIWSDMYFRMCSPTGGYYDPETHITDEVKANIPPEVQLAYWDYYHDNKDFYIDRIGRHREIGFEPIVASAVWCWGLLWYDKARTEAFTRPCIAACREAGVKEFFFTLWGDDGSYCEFESTMAGLAFGAEAAYMGDGFAPEVLARRFEAICGAPYEMARTAGDLNDHTIEMLWDDPILGILWKDRKCRDATTWEKAVARYEGVIANLAPVAKRTTPIDFAHAVNLARYLLAKVKLRFALEKAYAAHDRDGLAAVRAEVPKVNRLIDNLLASYRRQWYARNKPHGFEVIQIRLAGLKQRNLELSERLTELLAGKITEIPELLEAPTKEGFPWTYKRIASGSVCF